MRLEADFLGLAGVLRGRYESLDRSDVANDSLRMALSRSTDRYSDRVESSEPCLLRSDEPYWLPGDLEASDVEEEACNSCGWTKRGPGSGANAVEDSSAVDCEKGSRLSKTDVVSKSKVWGDWKSGGTENCHIFTLLTGG